MSSGTADPESYNPWTVVHVVFTHLAEEGLHPVLGDRGHPGAVAADLLRALGIEPAVEGNREIVRGVHAHLAELRTAMFGDEPTGPNGTAEQAPASRSAGGVSR